MASQSIMYTMKPQYEIGKIDLPNVMYESKQMIFGGDNTQNGNVSFESNHVINCPFLSCIQLYIKMA